MPPNSPKNIANSHKISPKNIAPCSWFFFWSSWGCAPQPWWEEAVQVLGNLFGEIIVVWYIWSCSLKYLFWEIKHKFGEMYHMRPFGYVEINHIFWGHRDMCRWMSYLEEEKKCYLLRPGSFFPPQWGSALHCTTGGKVLKCARPHNFTRIWSKT